MVRSWVSSPVESFRTWLRLAKRTAGDTAAARVEAAALAAAAESVRLALPGRPARRARRLLVAQVAAGSFPLADVRAFTDSAPADPAEALRAALALILDRASAPQLPRSPQLPPLPMPTRANDLRQAVSPRSSPSSRQPPPSPRQPPAPSAARAAKRAAFEAAFAEAGSVRPPSIC